MIVECPKCGVSQRLDRGTTLQHSINYRFKAPLDELAAMDRSPNLVGWRQGAETAMDKMIQDYMDDQRPKTGFRCLACKHVCRWEVIGWRRIENLIEIAVRVG